MAIVIDTDGGIDDAVALWWAVTHLDVHAVTTVWGNGDAAMATRSVLTVLAAAGRLDVPVVVGADGPIAPAPQLDRPDWIHGRDGLGNTNRTPPDVAVVPTDAASFLVSLPDGTDLVTIGPLTNVAAALRRDRSLASRLGRLVVMGGVARPPGNARPSGEANIAHDPTAAQEVLSSEWSEPPLLVGLDVTHRATLTDAEFGLLAEHRNDAAAFLDAPLRFYRDGGSRFTGDECPCHDLLAVLALADPVILTDAPVLPVAVDCGGGPAWGTTVVDLRGFDAEPGFSRCRVALDVDVARFRAEVRALFS